MPSNKIKVCLDESINSTVHILNIGYSYQLFDADEMHASGTCVLIKGSKNIIVDTMTAWDGEKLLLALKQHDVTSESIDYVINTHLHPDHTGCNFLFLKAKHICGNSVFFKDTYNNYTEIMQKLTHDVVVYRTPGHTLNCISVIVSIKKDGKRIAIAGDLFENEQDILVPSIWMNSGPENKSAQMKSRFKLANRCDVIIPGHGPPFTVTDRYRDALREQWHLSDIDVGTDIDNDNEHYECSISH